MSQKKLSLPIASAPVSILAVFLFAGINLACLVVDASGDAEASSAFYRVKTGSFGLKMFQLVMLVIGLLQYTANFFFAFTRNSSLIRRISDVFGFFLFVTSVYIGIALVGPLELSGGGNSGKKNKCGLCPSFIFSYQHCTFCVLFRWVCSCCKSFRLLWKRFLLFFFFFFLVLKDSCSK